MRRRAALFPRALLLLLVAGAGCGGGSLLAHADGNVGCLFSESLCTENVEWCYDDYAFGKCLQTYGSVEEEDLARHELTIEELRAFEHELQRLLQLGYRWSHAYTQCILQAMLYATKNRLHYEQTVCDHLADQDLTAALGAFEGEETVDPQTVAFVRYTPNSNIEASDFADEVYYPPNAEDPLEIRPSIQDPEMTIDNEDDLDLDPWHQEVKRAYIRKSRQNPLQSQTPQRRNRNVFPRNYNISEYFREDPKNPELILENLGQLFENNEESAYYGPLQDNKKIERYQPSIQLTSEEILYLLQPENEEELAALLPQYEEENDGYETTDERSIEKDRINAWLENQDLDQLRAALAELKEPYRQNVDPYYATSDFLTKNRLKPDKFNQHYNTPDRFRQGYESRDGVVDMNEEEGEMPEPRIYIDEDEQDHYREESGSGEHDGRDETLKELEYMATNEAERNNYRPYESLARNPSSSEEETAILSRMLNTWKVAHSQQPRQPQKDGAGVFTEGGVVFVANTAPTSHPGQSAPQLMSPELGALLADYEWGFRRRERLDVKKPGPPFDVNNRHFRTDGDENQTKAEEQPAVAVAPAMVKKELHESDEPEPPPPADHSHDNYDVDSSYAYVGLKDSIRTWKEGARIVRTISELLHLEPSAFSYPRVDRNEVTFRVGDNSKALNASEVANRIDGIKDKLKDELGVDVTSAGVGDKAKYPAVLKLKAGEPGWSLELPPWTPWRGAVVLTVSALSASVLIGLVSYLLRLRSRRRLSAKLGGCPARDAEASQDYQDLCRARMSGKWQTQVPEKGGDSKPETAGQRITSLSRESDGNSPSTRSSTSSWSEEPALTNMDISTGHMVLTYMEDHLKNKDRLEQEWRALCAYEAEPCVTNAAEREENALKNRAPGVLPYDHARLVLNDVTNITASDYINASTITDHDPRNPAYIAAQGPLPHTAADFWQLVWEQGSVVMVMLTRLTENGVGMCHRYWPEEGSELYHIYEVHLVSEHIWCDDYLVRSFYLKNLKTGETRTVTQFHFLSWPDRGVPASTKALLEFRRKVNKSYRGRSCPIVVHCSDGAGRTGTYCLIDMVLNRMAKGAKEIDIAATLEHIRDQRPHMVTTKQQFEFVLMAVAEEVHAILKALPAQLQQQHEKKEKELAAEKEKQDKQEKEK